MTSFRQTKRQQTEEPQLLQHIRLSSKLRIFCGRKRLVQEHELQTEQLHAYVNGRAETGISNEQSRGALIAYLKSIGDITNVNNVVQVTVQPNDERQVRSLLSNSTRWSRRSSQRSSPCGQWARRAPSNPSMWMMGGRAYKGDRWRARGVRSMQETCS